MRQVGDGNEHKSIIQRQETATWMDSTCKLICNQMNQIQVINALQQPITMQQTVIESLRLGSNCDSISQLWFHLSTGQCKMGISVESSTFPLELWLNCPIPVKSSRFRIGFSSDRADSAASHERDTRRTLATCRQPWAKCFDSIHKTSPHLKFAAPNRLAS